MADQTEEILEVLTMKYAVVGTSHGGYETVQTLLEKDPNAEIHLYEQGTTASFLSCGIQSYLEDESKSLDDIHYATADSYQKQGVHMHIETQVIDVDGTNHTITIKDKDGEHTETYDKLFLYPGAIATPLPVDGTDLDHVYYMRGRDWANAIKERMADAKKVVVIGGGYIGIEAAEAYALAGKDVTVVDFQDRILPTYLDKPFTDRLEQHAAEKGMKFYGDQGVKAIEGENGAVTRVVTDKGEYEADTVIIAIGVKPNTKWIEGKVDLDDKGFIKINNHGETSMKDIYSGGDATLIPFKPTDSLAPIALATNTRRQSVVAALNALGEDVTMKPINGTSGLHLFDYQFGATGVKDATADQYDGKVASHYMSAHIHPTFLKNIPEEDNTIYMQINYDVDSKVVLGAQFMSKGDVAGYANLVSLAIDNNYTLAQLGQADFFFQPEFNGPWHPVNTLAMAADGQTFGSDKMLFM
ncbi:MAG: FAD-dependent oxidoreductase [Aerococcus sp.]|nr:FAD-dependent oxidoreductase [Aerococcus sp.]